MGELEHIKSACRAVVRGRLATVTAAERDRQSRCICAFIQTQPWFLSAASLMAYVPLDDEPDITPLIAAALSRGVAVAFPSVDWDAKTLTPQWIDRWPCALRADRHGVQVPAQSATGPGSGPETGVETGGEHPQVVLLPGVAFDDRCRRLGRGGGFYDRYIAHRRQTAADGAKRVFAAGIALEAHMLDAVPVGPLDERLDGVVCPTRVVVASDTSLG